MVAVNSDGREPYPSTLHEASGGITMAYINENYLKLAGS